MTPDALASVRPDKIYMQAGIVDAQAAPVESLAAMSARATVRDRFVLQLDGPMTPARRQVLEQAGVVVHDYLPVNAYIVSLRPGAGLTNEAVPFVRWQVAYDKSWKIAPGIGDRTFATEERQALAARGQVGLIVNVFKGFDDQSVVEAVAAIPGVQVLYSEAHPRGSTLSLTMPKADVNLLADIDGVQFVEEAFEITLRNSTNRWIVQTGVLNNTPLYDNGIHGENGIIGILDGRVDSNHCAFSDTQPFGGPHRKIQAYNTTTGSDDHGTHVAGTCVGDAGSFDDNRGVAYMGKLVYNGIPSFTETGVVNALELHASQGASVHTNSWGDDGTTAYNSLARGFDVFCRDNESSLVCLAVTNTGSLRNPENAKNLLAVGACQDTPNLGSHCSGGTGPTSDSRRKPEIYAPGCGTISANGNTACGTQALTGTSMACPAVAGTGMLVRQYFRQGFYPSGSATPGDTIAPSGALLKAVLLNSAVDMTGVSGYPSNTEGWGRVRVADSLYFDGD
ncbi:MAG: S8 family serine peptidase, partial [Phycisphaerales bacterium]|nr:S8 family serine peptidase [Phycisphaerales bacterium]